MAETQNAVTPFVGCEKCEDMGAVVRFTNPYVFVAGAKQWFRLTGGHPSEILRDMTVPLQALALFLLIVAERVLALIIHVRPECLCPLCLTLL